MASFRLTDGSGGCPPTETPPPGYYEIPFRFDASGNLWITGCFDNFKFFGYARHDLPTPVVMGQGGAPLNTADDIVSGDGITAGAYTSLNITNDTPCTIGVLLGYDLNADLDVKGTNYAIITLSGRWNGANVDTVKCSSVRTGSSAYARCFSGNAANPHDPAIEAGGAPGMTLAPGASAVVGCRLFLTYGEGAPDGVDRIVSAGSAVRVYGYCL